MDKKLDFELFAEEHAQDFFDAGFTCFKLCEPESSDIPKSLAFEYPGIYCHSIFLDKDFAVCLYRIYRMLKDDESFLRTNQLSPDYRKHIAHVWDTFLKAKDAFLTDHADITLTNPMEFMERKDASLYQRYLDKGWTGSK